MSNQEPNKYLSFTRNVSNAVMWASGFMVASAPLLKGVNLKQMAIAGGIGVAAFVAKKICDIKIKNDKEQQAAQINIKINTGEKYSIRINGNVQKGNGGNGFDTIPYAQSDDKFSIDIESPITCRLNVRNAGDEVQR